jgi:hypothetical protein
MSYIILINRSPILWSSYLDKTKVNKSSCEAEYKVLSKALTKINELLPNFNTKIKFFIYNETVKDILKSDASSKRMRHIDIDYHYVEDDLQRKNCSIEHITSAAHLTAMFTKPL